MRDTDDAARSVDARRTPAAAKAASAEPDTTRRAGQRRRISCAVRAVVGDAMKPAPDIAARGWSAIFSIFGLQQLPDPVGAVTLWCEALALGGVAVILYWPSGGGVVETSGPWAVFGRLAAARAAAMTGAAAVPAAGAAVPHIHWPDQLAGAARSAGVEVRLHAHHRGRALSLGSHCHRCPSILESHRHRCPSIRFARPRLGCRRRPPLRAGAGGPLRAAPDPLDIGRSMLGRHDTRWAVARHAPPTRGRFCRRDARRFYHRVWSTAPRCNWAEQRKSATRRAAVDPCAARANSCSAQAPTSRGPMSAARAPGSL